MFPRDLADFSSDHRKSCRIREADTLREMEFKMERHGLLEVGQQVTITEGVLPTSWYYIIDPSLAMSGNFTFLERLKSREGVVKGIDERPQGYYVTVEFDE